MDNLLKKLKSGLKKGKTEDFHIHCNDDRFKAFLFLEKFKKKFDEEERKKTFISFSEHESFRIYSDFLLHKLAKNKGINVIPSVSFVCNDNIEVISLFPKNRTFKLLYDKQKEKLERILLILQYLYDLGLNITAEGLTSQIGRPGDFKSLHYVEDKHIINELANNDLNERESLALFERIENDFNINKKSSYEILTYLQEEAFIYLTSEDEEVFSDFDFDRFTLKGLILNNVSEKTFKILQKFQLDLKIGSGANL